MMLWRDGIPKTIYSFFVSIFSYICEYVIIILP